MKTSLPPWGGGGPNGDDGGVAPVDVLGDGVWRERYADAVSPAGAGRGNRCRWRCGRRPAG